MYGLVKLIIGALFVSCSLEAWAQDITELKESIFNIKSFKAQYVQEVVAKDGKILQNGTGVVEMLRPNFFKMEVKEPSEAMILADGTNIYNYDEMLEQVTIYEQKNAVHNSPFMLLVSSDEALWAQYEVKNIGPLSFEVSAKNKTSTLTTCFKIELLEDNGIKKLTLIETDGRTNSYIFTKEDTELKPNDFTYTIPDGITVDDQRTK